MSESHPEQTAEEVMLRDDIKEILCQHVNKSKLVYDDDYEAEAQPGSATVRLTGRLGPSPEDPYPLVEIFNTYDQDNGHIVNAVIVRPDDKEFMVAFFPSGQRPHDHKSEIGLEDKTLADLRDMLKLAVWIEPEHQAAQAPF